MSETLIALLAFFAFLTVLAIAASWVFVRMSEDDNETFSKMADKLSED